MIRSRHFDPRMPSKGQAVAKTYMRNLNILGYCAMVLVGHIPFAMNTLQTSLYAAALLGIAFVLGHEYRRYVKELLEHLNAWDFAKLVAKAWKFWVAGMCLSGLAIGTVQWGEFDVWKGLISWLGIVGLLMELAYAVATKK